MKLRVSIGAGPGYDAVVIAFASPDRGTKQNV